MKGLDEEGVNKMSPVIVEYAQEIMKDERKEFAINLLELGKMTYDEIATAAKLPESKVRELAEQIQVATR